MRGSIHVRVRFKSDNGFTSVQHGYSGVSDLSNKRLMYKHAIWNSAYRHIYAGGSYEWTYEVLSSEELIYTKEHTSKGKIYTKQTRKRVHLSSQNKRNISYDIKKHNKQKSGRIEGSTETRDSMKSMYAEPKKRKKKV